LTFNDGAIHYKVFTDDILTADILDGDDLVGQSYLGKILLGQHEYYVEDIDDEKITIVCGAEGTVTTSVPMEYTAPAEGSACDAANSDQSYSIRLVGAQTIEEKGVVDVTLEVTKPDGTTEQVTSGISGTPVVGDIKVKLQKGTAASNVITGEQSFSAEIKVWYVPSEYTFEHYEEYNEMGEGPCDETGNGCDEDADPQWKLLFNGEDDATPTGLVVADVEYLEDYERIAATDYTSGWCNDTAPDMEAQICYELEEIEIDENEQWDDCYEDTDDMDTQIVRFLDFELQELPDDFENGGLPEGDLINLPFNDGLYLLSDLKFGYMGLLDEDFMGWDSQDKTVVEVEIIELEIMNGTDGEGNEDFMDVRTGVVLSFTDSDGQDVEARIDEGPFEEDDVVLVGTTLITLEDFDYVYGPGGALDDWIIEYTLRGLGEDEEDEEDYLYLNATSGLGMLDVQIGDDYMPHYTLIETEYSSAAEMGPNPGGLNILDDQLGFGPTQFVADLDNLTDEGEAQLYWNIYDATDPAGLYWNLTGLVGPNAELEIDGLTVEAGPMNTSLEEGVCLDAADEFYGDITNDYFHGGELGLADYVCIEGDVDMGVELDDSISGPEYILIQLDDDYNDSWDSDPNDDYELEAFVNVTEYGCEYPSDCRKIAEGTDDGVLLGLAGALIAVEGDEDVEEPEDSSRDEDETLEKVTVTIPENELRPTIFFGLEESQNSTSITITDADVNTVVNIGGLDVTVEEFGVTGSVSGGQVIGGEAVTVECDPVTVTCDAVTVETMAPANIGYKLVVVEGQQSKSNLVLIGGPSVNSMTKDMTTVDELCSAAVVKLVGSKLLVAGCEAADTAAAAQSLMDWLSANV
jgi:hypothetical protein